MKKIKLIMTIHCHQPAGNLEPVIERAHERCYAPLLMALERHPGVRLGLHLSGCLLEWLEQNRPTYLTDLRRLVERGQVELLGGGFYEPVLTAIPDPDALGQLGLMQDYLEDRFGVKARGAWLAERVWDASAARLLGLAGLEYTLLDDAAFFQAGLPPGRLSGYYATESAGRPLALLPLDRGLRYAIPWKPVSEVLAELRALADQGVSSLTYADDGEKLGLWPGSHAWVHEQGWLEDFLAALEDSQAWLETAPPASLLDAEPPRGRVYPPSGAYEELGGWSLPAEAGARLAELRTRLEEAGLAETAAPFLRAGGFGGFLARYDEAERMRQKMLVVSRKLAQAAREAGAWSDEHEQARLSLYRAQGHDATWHGLFGGVYLPHLRAAVYRDLLEAECALDRFSQGEGDWIAFDQLDLDADRRDEALVETAQLNAYLDPGQGGCLTELDYRPAACNLLDVLTRVPELSHRPALDAQTGGPQPEAEEDELLAGRLGLDRVPRRIFLDRFPAPAAPLEAMLTGSYEEEGDFLQGAYQVERLGIDEAGDCDFEALLWRRGSLARQGRAAPLELTKHLRVPADRAEVSVRYQLKNPGEEPLEVAFCPELSLSLGDPEASAWEHDGLVGAGPRAATVGEVQEAGWIALVDRHRRLRIRLSQKPAAAFWRHPIESLSRSEVGLTRILQGVALIPRHELRLEPGQSATVELRLEILPLDEDAVVPLEAEGAGG